MERIYQKHDTQHVAATVLYVPHQQYEGAKRFYYDKECTKGVTEEELLELFYSGRVMVADEEHEYSPALMLFVTGPRGYYATQTEHRVAYAIDYFYAT